MTCVPKGFDVTVLMKPEFKQLGTYRELPYDAYFDYRGLRWWHVEGGFGGRGERNDWVADVPAVDVSVTEHFRRKGWYGWDGDLTIQEAMDREIDVSCNRIVHTVRNLSNRLADAVNGQRLLAAAVRDQPKEASNG